MDSIFGRMTAAYQVLRRHYGMWLLPLVGAGYHTTARALVSVALRLDPLFFRTRVANTRLVAPIVLIGPPRTGTTLLHRFLSNGGYGAGTEVWRGLFPSLVMQAVLRPALPLVKRFDPTQWHATAAHETSLTSVETDEAGTMFRYFDGPLLYSFVFALHDPDLFAQFDPRERDTAQRDFGWVRHVWLRNLAATGCERQIGKLFSVGPRVPSFSAAFPDARMIYTVRDPLQAIPSAMSLVSGVLDRAVAFSTLPPDVQALWCTRTYRGLTALLNGFAEDWTSGKIDRERVLLVRYDRLLSDFAGVMDDVHAFIGHQPTPAQCEAIAAQAERQRNHASGHTYDLERFHLDETALRRDCAAFYDAFGDAYILARLED